MNIKIAFSSFSNNEEQIRRPGTKIIIKTKRGVEFVYVVLHYSLESFFSYGNFNKKKEQRLQLEAKLNIYRTRAPFQLRNEDR